MKKILYLLLICSVLTLSADMSFAKSSKKEKTKKSDEIHIVKPEKVKVNKRLERKKSKQNAETKKQNFKRIPDFTRGRVFSDRSSARRVVRRSQ